jgi:hypothetical protein
MTAQRRRRRGERSILRNPIVELAHQHALFAEGGAGTPVSPLELAVRILPGLATRDGFDRVPVLDNLPRLDPEQVTGLELAQLEATARAPRMKWRRMVCFLSSGFEVRS